METLVAEIRDYFLQEQFDKADEAYQKLQGEYAKPPAIEAIAVEAYFKSADPVTHNQIFLWLFVRTGFYWVESNHILWILLDKIEYYLKYDYYRNLCAFLLKETAKVIKLFKERNIHTTEIPLFEDRYHYLTSLCGVETVS
jgi:hypothetical protein